MLLSKPKKNPADILMEDKIKTALGRKQDEFEALTNESKVAQ